ncbi:MAG: transcription termination factor NusA [Patescibacteria group bacterium]
MDLKSFASAMSQIAAEKEIPEDKVLDIVEQAIATAYKKEYGEKGDLIKADFDPKSGEVKFWKAKKVVSEDMILSDEELEKLKKGEISDVGDKVRFNPKRHVMAEDTDEGKPGDEIKEPLESKEQFGRIAAQTAKQVVLQKVKETERDLTYEEYKEKEGEVISGVVQRVEGRKILVDIGKVLGVLSKDEQIPGEYYKSGQRYKMYVLKVEKNPKGPTVYLSRAFPRLVTRLFELEVPEISTGTVEIKAIAREAGSRSKVAVCSEEEGVDPVGTAVGQRGTRVGAIISELDGEKIDIIEWSDDEKELISNALSPANVHQVEIIGENKAVATVSEDELSLAIGKEGQNVRLAANLTGWKIDVKSLGDESSEEEDSEEENE